MLRSRWADAAEHTTTEVMRCKLPNTHGAARVGGRGRGEQPAPYVWRATMRAGAILPSGARADEEGD
jgi:hypothetical protein